MNGGSHDAGPAAFTDPDPRAALSTFIEVFCDLWSSDRLVHRRMHLDPELERALATRNERRREGLRVLVRRIANRDDAAALEELLDCLHVLTSFHVFDQLATPERGDRATAALIEQLAWLALQR